MSHDQFVFLGVAAGLAAYLLVPILVRRLRDWLGPEPLAEYRLPYRDLDD